MLCKGESVKQAFQELVSLLLNNQAILDKLYQQRDGNLGRGGSYHGPNPYSDKSSSENDEKGSDDDTPTRRKKGKKMAKLRKKLSWKSKKNGNQEYKEYTEEDYNINLEKSYNSSPDINAHGGGCCK